MTHVPNIETLHERHAELDAKLEVEISRPLPDQTIITEIKRQKLRIKDRMATLETV